MAEALTALTAAPVATKLAMASPRPGGSPGRDALENTASREELEQIDELMYTTQMRELRAIGSGSFGSAVLVEMVVSRERFVAKKIPLEHLTEEDKAKALSEAALLRSLRHDNITEYFGSFVSANTLHILMEYCSGGSLQQVMARRERNGETFDDEEVFDWFLQIAKALEHVHAQKILHRDIKTSNVFLTKRNLVKLGDFGIARQMDETSDFAQTCVGTPYYLSPEVIEGARRRAIRRAIRRAQFLRAILAQPARPPPPSAGRPYNARSDVWALGVLAYQMVAFHYPFEAPTLPALALRIVSAEFTPLPTETSADVAALIGALLCKDVDARPTMEEVLALRPNPIATATPPLHLHTSTAASTSPGAEIAAGRRPDRALRA